jgi:hypothetical protein
LGKISPNKPVESRGKADGKHAQSQAIARDLGGRDQEGCAPLHDGEIEPVGRADIAVNHGALAQRDHHLGQLAARGFMLDRVHRSQRLVRRRRRVPGGVGDSFECCKRKDC